MSKPVVFLLIYSGLMFVVVAIGFFYLRQAARQYDLNEQLDNAAIYGNSSAGGRNPQEGVRWHTA
ncbi:MAG TPA: hypothetical protein VFA07_20070 [Chthonomonadaceae bacterium]|nr:hypothetical protein [Chthonomonadaceae bacterium]